MRCGTGGLRAVRGMELSPGVQKVRAGRGDGRLSGTASRSGRARAVLAVPCGCPPRRRIAAGRGCSSVLNAGGVPPRTGLGARVPALLTGSVPCGRSVDSLPFVSKFRGRAVRALRSESAPGRLYRSGGCSWCAAERLPDVGDRDPRALPAALARAVGADGHLRTPAPLPRCCGMSR